ncbi:MAG: methyltransferase domain-containing protein [Methanobacteriota archaeon]
MSGVLQLHIGCGERFIPGFVHIDVRKFPHIDHVTSADKLQMFEDNSVDLIYCAHILEHFPRPRTKAVLAEWHRVLKPKGVLRVAVPDFEALAEVYSGTGDISKVLGPLVGRQDYPENTHYMVFDFISLKNLLESVGFVNIRRYDWRETIHRDYDDFSQAYIPHMDKERGRLISLNVEAEKQG